MKIFLLSLLASLAFAAPDASHSTGAGADIRAEWEQIADGEALPWVYALAADDHTLYAGGRGGLYISEDDGHAWRQTMEPGVRSLAISANHVYAGTANHGVFRSTDRGNTWERINVGLPAQLNGKRPAIQQILITNSGSLIALTHDNGSFVSYNRGAVWHDQSDDWTVGVHYISREIRSMTEFDGYLWAYLSTGWIVRALSERTIWGSVKWFERGRITDWAVVNDELYAAGVRGFGRWNEVELGWEYFGDGLPTGPYSPHVTTLAAHRGRIFAGLNGGGVYLFDERAERFIPAGLQDYIIGALISHRSHLYASTEQFANRKHTFEGIYRASIPVVQPYGKAAATWGAIRQRHPFP
ncbi:MAG: hypothetical protein OXN17_18955 [Candidatus Poribacteria bacterium]|nr:hypothetical protein [Candidatus Poribacteria bacterium]MDE0503808.1 hypothetical protein [Candidatus Poribacteria bacterium]